MKNILKLVLLIGILFSSFLYAINDQQAQIKTVTDFYTRYLNQEYEQGWPSIFSSRLKKALDENIEDCRKFVRNGDMCGYTADGDLLLNAQDYSETLKFSNSNFSAITKPGNLITVSFVLFPEEEDKGDRELNFTMAKENNQWKIDDIESSAYESIKSERDALVEINAPLENAIADLKITFEYLGHEYFFSFINDKTELCKNNQCNLIKKAEIANLYKKIFDFYFKKTSDDSIKPIRQFVSLAAVEKSAAEEHKKMTTGIFSWEFQDQIWMITKIDLDTIK